VWRAAGLAQWDKHVAGKLSEPTRRALRAMLLQQSSHGGYVVVGEVEIPYVTTDYELTLHAVRAVVEAPGFLADLSDADLLRRIERMKAFLRETKPRNDYERALRIGLAALVPGLVRKDDRDADLAMLRSRQRPDGGWSTRSMSETRNWRTPMSAAVVKLIEGLPDAADPGSDPYMTALAIVLLRESGAPADDACVRRGVAWLKAEQRESGLWWMHSLYRGNYHFTTYLATAKALQALGACGEVPEMPPMAAVPSKPPEALK
jgi:squalene-hopene/tetraprenyl-beta-curcumene cyclase